MQPVCRVALVGQYMKQSGMTGMVVGMIIITIGKVWNGGLPGIIGVDVVEHVVEG